MWVLQLNPVDQVFISFSGQRTAASNGKELTCVWCRARWIVARPGGGAAGSAKKSMGRYINLSDVADVSPVRDTSTCKRDPPQNVRYAHIPSRLSRSKERRTVLWISKLFGWCVMSALRVLKAEHYILRYLSIC
jgi:hypothetical protein